MVRKKMNTYLQPIFQNIDELKTIHEIFDEEMNRMADNAKVVCEASNVLTTNEDTIKRWEENFDINTPSGSLRHRQNTVLNILRTTVPYTKAALKKFLDDAIGPETETWELTYDHRPDRMTIHLQIKATNPYSLRSVIEYFKQTIPVNYGFSVSVLNRSWADYRQIATWKQLKPYTWQETKDGVAYTLLTE